MRRFLILALALLMLLSTTACLSRKIAEVLIPTPEPTAVPTAVPTEVPTPEPTPEPTQKPLEAADLAGIWSLTSIRYGDSTLAPSDFGMEMYLEFREDGTVRAIQNSNGDYSEETAPFTIRENTLVFTENGSETEVAYDPEADTLTFFLEENGTQIGMILSRTPDAVLPEPPAAQAATDESAFVGTWELSHAVYSGITIPADQLPEEGLITLYFNEDGTAAMRSGGQYLNDSGIFWKLNGSVVQFGAYGAVIYELEYDFDTGLLKLHEAETNVDFYLKKAD